MKRILVLYPGLGAKGAKYLAPHRWKLRLAGIGIVLADERILAEERKVVADALLMPPAEDVAEGWSRLRAYLDTHRVDAVLAQSEPSLFLGGLAARHLGVPGPHLAGTLASTSKWLTRTKLRAAELPQPAFALSRSASEVRRFAEQEAGWPVVLKAVASTRQRLVTVVRSPSQVEAAVARVRAGLPGARDVRRLLSYCGLEDQDPGCNPLTEFLVESYAPGAPLETEGLVQRGVPHCMGVVEQLQRDDGSFFIDGYALPAERPHAELEALAELSARALAALGVDDTGYSIEFRAAADTTKLIEVNGRLGWDEGLGELFAAAGCGLPALLAARLAFGKRLGDIGTKRSAGLAFHSQLEAGFVESVPRPRAAARSIASCKLHVAAGDRVLAIEEPESRPHLLHVIATDRHSSRRAHGVARGVADRLGAAIVTTPVPGESQRDAEHRAPGSRSA